MFRGGEEAYPKARTQDFAEGVKPDHPALGVNREEGGGAVTTVLRSKVLEPPGGGGDCKVIWI